MYHSGNSVGFQAERFSSSEVGCVTRSTLMNSNSESCTSEVVTELGGLGCR